MSFIDLSFLFGQLLFFIATILAFSLPGNLFIKRLNLPFWQNYTLSTSLGIVWWALTGFLFGQLQTRFLSYVYLFIVFLVWIRGNHSFINIDTIRKIKKVHIDYLFVGLAVISIFVQLLSTWYNGFSTDGGLYFCCGENDALFHIALTDHLVSNFPPQEPGMSGVFLENYHFLTNLVMADLIRVFHLPVLTIAYPYMTLFITVFFYLSLYTFGSIALGKRDYTALLIFFAFFSGDILYLLGLFLGKNLNFDTQFLHDATKLWFSPSRMFSAFIFFSALSFLVLFIKNKSKYIGILMAFMMGSLIGFKVYMGILVLIGCGFLCLYFLIQKKRRLIIPFVITFIISLSVYLPINFHSGGLVYTGFWRVEDFIVNPAVNLSQMVLARQTYTLHGNWLRVVGYELIFIFLYLVFVFGILSLGFLQNRRSLSLLKAEVNIFLIPSLLVILVAGLFFMQKTGGANSSQFLITFEIVVSVYSALAIFYWQSRMIKPLKYIFILLVIILTVPRVVYESIIIADRYVFHKYGFLIDNEELSALSYIKNKKEDNTIILMNKYDKCIYVSFMTNSRIFYCGDGAPGDRGVDTKKRSLIADAILRGKNTSYMRDLLIDNKINYLYLKDQSAPLDIESAKYLKKVFLNSRIRIYKVMNKT